MNDRQAARELTTPELLDRLTNELQRLRDRLDPGGTRLKSGDVRADVPDAPTTKETARELLHAFNIQGGVVGSPVRPFLDHSSTGSDSRIPSPDEVSKASAPHSAHYKNDKGIEPIDLIEAGNLPFHLGNVIKYIYRAYTQESKSIYVRESLEKARWYLERYMSLRK